MSEDCALYPQGVVVCAAAWKHHVTPAEVDCCPGNKSHSEGSAAINANRQSVPFLWLSLSNQSSISSVRVDPLRRGAETWICEIFCHLVAPGPKVFQDPSALWFGLLVARTGDSQP